MERKQKQPSEVYDYYISGDDYFSEIEDEDEIDTVVVSKDITTSPDLELGPGALPDHVLVGANPQDFKIWVGGGLDGSTYVIKSVITTVVGRVEEYEFKLKVKEI